MTNYTLTRTHRFLRAGVMPFILAQVGLPTHTASSVLPRSTCGTRANAVTGDCGSERCSQLAEASLKLRLHPAPCAQHTP